ncbi:MAG: hypothetical protein ACXAEX_10065 [Promethearchaeota archaeon]|jgi:hypothetical protein
MDSERFAKRLNEVRELMTQERYVKALEILEKLKETEKNSEYDYNYNLIHQLYQLDSNCKSARNQQIILNHLKNISTEKKSISLNELNQILRNEENLSLSEDILKRELELLILRNEIQCKIDENSIIF